jgi:hypothetical protein
MKPSAIVHRISNLPWLAEFISLLSGLVVLIQGIVYAHHMTITMDEGTYLVKGLLFVRGIYAPFQDYGPWTNKMPLSFLIPGIPQALFEPGLRTGRYFSIFLALLTLLGLWLASKRVGGRWWAAATVWLFAINPAAIMFYTLAISQVIAACFLTWSLALILGQNRSRWEVLLGAALSVCVVLTRQNLLPLMVFTILFIFWSYGRKTGWQALLVAVFVFGLVHVIYWPGIIKYIWYGWIPGFLKPLVNALGVSPVDTAGALKNPREAFPTLSKLSVLWEGVRYNFGAVAGALAAWFFWPRKEGWRFPQNFKAAIFLSITFVSMAILHYWAAVGLDYCPYCFSGYLTFFSPAGLLLPAVVFSGKARQPGWPGQSLAVLAVIAGCTGIAFGAQQFLDDPLLTLQVPRTRNMRILPGTTDLWRMLANKFHWSYELLQTAMPTVAGLLGGLLLVGLAFLLARTLRNRPNMLRAGSLAILVFLLAGVLLSPTALMGGGKLVEQCAGDVILAHEAAGQILAEEIPPGSLVYWQGNTTSPLPLLYIPDVRIFPPQLNHSYSYFLQGDPDVLYKNGFWNEELANRWRHEADFILTGEKASASGDWRNTMQAEGIRMDELHSTAAVIPCNGRSIIHIYRRER